MSGQVWFGGTTSSESASAPLQFGPWSREIVLGEPNLSSFGRAFGSATNAGAASSTRINFTVRSAGVANDGILDARAAFDSAFIVTFVLRRPVQFALEADREYQQMGIDTADALLRLERKNWPDVFSYEPRAQSGFRLTNSGRLMPGEYTLKVVTSVRADESGAGQISLGSVSGAIEFAPLDIVPVQRWRWRARFGGNGHVYESWRSDGPISWDEAGRIATALGGLLATPSTATENQALFQSLASNPVLWTPGGTPRGPWLGGAQVSGAAEPGGGWFWISGEPFDVQNWWISKPDNASNANRMAYFGAFTLIQPYWGDYVGDDASVKSFIVEYPATYCPADFDGGGVVDDSDFVIFSAAYDAFVCATGPGCEGDFTDDGFVDDADFVIFTQAYDAFACP